MSGPKGGRGRDAFDDFFGDPTPSGHMGPASTNPGQTPAHDADADRTRDIDLRGDETGSATRGQAQPPIEPAPAPTGAVPEEWWTSEPEPTPAAAASPTWHAAPVPAVQPGGRPPRRSVSPLALLAMLVGGVLLGGLCVGGILLAINQDDDETPVASETTVTETSSETPSSTSSTPSTSSSTKSSSTSSSSSSSSSPTRSGELPAGVTKCAGPSSGTAVGRGTEVTTCDFAVAVRDAYVAEKPKGKVSLEVRSPVTNKSYTMSCSGQSVTRCTGGNDAVVVLY